MLAALLLAAVTPTVSATPAAFRAVGWGLECSVADTRSLDCRAVQQIVRTANGQTFVAMTVRLPAETKKPVVLIQLPLGILVSASVKMSVGNAAAQTLAVQTCTQAGCFAGAEASETTIAGMRSGQPIRVAFSNLDKRTVTVTIPSAGFEAVYTKL